MSGLAEVLAAHSHLPHVYTPNACRCGWMDKRYFVDHIDHLAAAVTDWLTERLASDEVREAVAFALGDLPESVNVYDMTDEATTVIEASVDYVADAALTAVTAALRGES